MKKKSGSLGTLLYEILVLFLGATVYAVGYRFFIEPCQLVLGGATGVATLLHYVFLLPVGIGFLIVNLPLLLLGSIFFHCLDFKSSISLASTLLHQNYLRI